MSINASNRSGLSESESWDELIDQERPLAAGHLNQSTMSAGHQLAAIPDCYYPCSFKLKLRITLFELAVDPLYCGVNKCPLFMSS
jgi:hypothetical protein